MHLIRAVVALVALGGLVLPCAASATFPGANGRIVFVSDRVSLTPPEIYSMNPDGSGVSRLTDNDTSDGGPVWSPDGNRIAFNRRLEPQPSSFVSDVFSMNADGSGQTNLINNFDDDYLPSWSPDGSKIVFVSDRDTYGAFIPSTEIYVMNADGTDPRRLTFDADTTDSNPVWSPDATTIAFDEFTTYVDDETGNFGRTTPQITTMNADGSGRSLLAANAMQPNWSPDGNKIVFVRPVECPPQPCNPSQDQIWTMNADGTNQHELQNGLMGEIDPAWSPDGTKIVFTLNRYPELPEIYVMNADGSGATNISNTQSAQDGATDWQPIPITGYPRPKGATPTLLPLVVAFKPCTAPNRDHGPPLAVGSCAPPAQSSDQLTTGRDANFEVKGMRGFLRLDAVLGDPTTAADEADVRLKLSITDMRLMDHVSDYTGELQARPILRITDNDNTPNPGGPGAATTEDTPFPFTAPCTATADTAIGSSCSVLTTADTVLPGSVKELKRTIWQLVRFELYDGGSDGIADTTADNTVFARAGIFAP